jgi:peptidoglycan/LPS O-acetylase OafA/YrhL
LRAIASYLLGRWWTGVVVILSGLALTVAVIAIPDDGDQKYAPWWQPVLAFAGIFLAVAGVALLQERFRRERWREPQWRRQRIAALSELRHSPNR